MAIYDGTYAIGAGPRGLTSGPRPQANNVRMPATKSGHRRGGSVVSVADGQWLFFRAVVGWWGADGRWYQRQGSLLAS